MVKMFSTTKWFESGWKYYSDTVDGREVSLPHYADAGDTGVCYVKEFKCACKESTRYLFYCEGNPLPLSVTLNGKALDRAEDMDGICHWDLTSALAADNTLTLSVAAGEARPDVYRNVWLREVDAVSVSALPLIKTYAAPGEIATLRTALTLDNHTDAARKVTVEYALLSGNETVHANKHETIVCPGVPAKVQIAIDSLRVDLWTPEKPATYRLQVDVLDGEKRVERMVKTVAFRNLEQKDGFYFLNGGLRFLKGVSYAERDMLAPADNGWYRLCRHAVNAGCNALVADYPPAFAEDTALQMGLILLKTADLPANTTLYSCEQFPAADDMTAKQYDAAVKAFAAYTQAEEDPSLATFFVDHHLMVDDFGRECAAVKVFAAAWKKTPVFQMEYINGTVALFGNAERYIVYVNDHAVQELPPAGPLTVFTPDMAFAELKVEAHFANGSTVSHAIHPQGAAVKLRLTAENYGRNLGNNRVDFIPVIAEAVDANGNRVTDVEGEVEFTPYTSGVIRAEEEFTVDTGIASDAHGNVVSSGKKVTETTSGYRVPFRNGMASVRYSAKNNSRFTAVSAECPLGKETVFINY